MPLASARSAGESVVHKKEISRFDDLVGEELGFKCFTYQELFKGLEKVGAGDEYYMSYLSARYFN